jgi:hypothetical protein
MFFDHLNERNAMVKSITYFDNFTKWTFLVVDRLIGGDSMTLSPTKRTHSSWTNPQRSACMSIDLYYVCGLANAEVIGHYFVLVGTHRIDLSIS